MEGLLFLLYNAKFWAKIATDGHYSLIGTRWEETLSRHVTNGSMPKFSIVL